MEAPFIRRCQTVRERSATTHTVEDLRGHFVALLDDELSPPCACETICGEALGRDNGPWPELWLLWAVLGARWEAGDPGRRVAEHAIRLAAREWLEVEDDDAEWQGYFERWLHAAPSEALEDPGWATH